MQSEGDGLKYPYKDEEHAEKSSSLNRFFVLLFFVHISYKTFTSTVFT